MEQGDGDGQSHQWSLGTEHLLEHESRGEDERFCGMRNESCSKAADHCARSIVGRRGVMNRGHDMYRKLAIFGHQKRSKADQQDAESVLLHWKLCVCVETHLSVHFNGRWLAFEGRICILHYRRTSEVLTTRNEKPDHTDGCETHKYHRSVVHGTCCYLRRCQNK